METVYRSNQTICKIMERRFSYKYTFMEYMSAHSSSALVGAPLHLRFGCCSPAVAAPATNKPILSRTRASTPKTPHKGSFRYLPTESFLPLPTASTASAVFLSRCALVGGRTYHWPGSPCPLRMPSANYIRWFFCQRRTRCDAAARRAEELLARSWSRRTHKDEDTQ